MKKQVTVQHEQLWWGYPHAAWRRINIATSESYRLWSLLSARHRLIVEWKTGYYLAEILERSLAQEWLSAILTLLVAACTASCQARKCLPLSGTRRFNSVGPFCCSLYFCAHLSPRPEERGELEAALPCARCCCASRAVKLRGASGAAKTAVGDAGEGTGGQKHITRGRFASSAVPEQRLGLETAFGSGRGSLALSGDGLRLHRGPCRGDPKRGGNGFAEEGCGSAQDLN